MMMPDDSSPQTHLRERRPCGEAECGEEWPGRWAQPKGALARLKRPPHRARPLHLLWGARAGKGGGGSGARLGGQDGLEKAVARGSPARIHDEDYSVVMHSITVDPTWNALPAASASPSLPTGAPTSGDAGRQLASGRRGGSPSTSIGTARLSSVASVAAAVPADGHGEKRSSGHVMSVSEIFLVRVRGIH
jgi:hypothetical protein